MFGEISRKARVYFQPMLLQLYVISTPNVGFDGWLNKCERRRTEHRNDAGFYGRHLPGESRMRSRGISGLVWGVFFVASLTATINPSAAANCALYVRAETGVALYGAAAGWWD